ncbi:MAG: LamG-like jellyroll fold domain-containing protein [Pseudomonadota bacterium]
MNRLQVGRSAPAICFARQRTAGLKALLAGLLLFLALAHSTLALAAPELLPGRYQLPGQPVYCELRQLGQDAWQMSLWQGDQAQEANPSGLALLARLLSESNGRRLAGPWQSLPASCCPGQGRVEIEALSADSFRFALFTPALDQPAWPLAEAQIFQRVGDLPPRDAGQALAGGWRLSMWYSDLLPHAEPADPQEGPLLLAPREGAAVGAWRDHAGQARLEPTPEGARFIYQDPQAHFEIKADLRPLAQGLAYQGQFLSTLGEGRLRLVRQGLPAEPPGNPLAGQGELSGLWVDRRTGSDFVKIEGTARAMEFTAYGGQRDRPRYLSQGQARASAPQMLEGTAQDQKGQCCGNQARLSFRLLEHGRLQVRAFWWPQDKPDPGEPLGEPYLLERVRPAKLAPAETGGEQWPQVFAWQAGLLPAQGGAVRASFAWQPTGSGQAATIFCQGGYGQELDLFIDQNGRLAGRLATSAGLVGAVAPEPLSQGQEHQAWLVYQAGGHLRLFLDGRQVAAEPLPQPWLASRSPYLVGASRWPLRDFEGSITSLELWDQPADPAHPGPPNLTLDLAQEPDQPQEEAAPPTAPLLRLYSPRLLRHAYAVGQDQVAALKEQGYDLQGPVGRLWTTPQPGGLELWAFRHKGQGYTLLRCGAEAPPDSEPLGRLGYVFGQVHPPSQPLYQLEGRFEDPLRGGQPRDMLYTSRADQLPRLGQEGYSGERLICHLAPEAEPMPQAPLTYTWQGVWGGDGWGRFFMLRQGHDLHLFWYYGQADGPRYFGRLRLSPDGRQAQGLAVGQPGPTATYYRLELTFDLEAPQGPRLRQKSWRLAAPLDDGRLVRFVKPQASEVLLMKTGPQVPAEEAAILREVISDPASDPQTQMRAALEQAKRQGRLLER